MHQDRPSATAWRVALRRAVHQIADHPVVLRDSFAIPLVGSRCVDDFVAEEARATPPRRLLSMTLRAFVVARSCFAEAQLADAVTHGTRQYVLLGAGLDTFALRNPFAAQGVRVFEVDHPATQQWKRERLARAGLAAPECLAFVPTDFEKQALPETLHAAGFHNDQPAVFAWLGVVPYLTREAFIATLRYLGTGMPGNRVAFDYAVPPNASDPREQTIFEMLMRRVAAVGEPFKLFLNDAEMDALLGEYGLAVRERLDSPAINAAYFPARNDQLSVSGNVGRLLCAQMRRRDQNA